MKSIPSNKSAEKWSVFWLILLTFGLFQVVCDCGTTGPATENGDPDIEQAWDYYSQGLWDEAIAEFVAIAENGNHIAEAFSGIGWSKLHRIEPQGGLTAFQISLLEDPNYLNSLAGEAFAQRDIANPDYSRLLDKARKCLELDADYEFEREISVNNLDLHLLMAQIFFTQHQFDSTLFRCLQVDPELNLAPEDTLSWSDAGSFEAALLSELERLSILLAN
jgi:hypothetical protein